MRKYAILLAVMVVAAGAAQYYFAGDRTANASGSSEAPAAGGRRGGGAGGGRGGARAPMTVELATVAHADMAEQVTVVGNLIGAATVDAVPKAQGRLEEVFVKLGDPVRRGQPVAKLEDREIAEQVKQAEATYNVSQATIRQREADLRLAQTNLDRSKSLYDRELLPRSTMDDTDARYQAAQAQLDLARAQMDQAKARLDELRINLSNTVITSPVDGFVGKRTLDAGASVGVNTSFMSVVDIRTVRLVANVIEKDLRRISAGTDTAVEVDAFPGETFHGRVARIAPILDPATRTAQVEIEIPNPSFRLKPGMYARVKFTVERHDKAVVVPTLALVDASGKTGVFIPNDGLATFQPVTLGIQQQELTEVVAGLEPGQKIVSTGAAALRDGDRILLGGQRNGGGRRGRGLGQSGGPAPELNAERAQRGQQ